MKATLKQLEMMLNQAMRHGAQSVVNLPFNQTPRS